MIRGLRGLRLEDCWKTLSDPPSLALSSPFSLCPLLPTSHGLPHRLTLDFFFLAAFSYLCFFLLIIHINFHSDPSWPCYSYVLPLIQTLSYCRPTDSFHITGFAFLGEVYVWLYSFVEQSLWDPRRQGSFPQKRWCMWQGPWLTHVIGVELRGEELTDVHPQEAPI